MLELNDDEDDSVESESDRSPRLPVALLVGSTKGPDEEPAEERALAGRSKRRFWGTSSDSLSSSFAPMAASRNEVEGLSGVGRV